MLNLQKIKELSENSGTSLSEVAKMLQTSPQALSKMIRENSTKVSTLEKLSEIFHVPVGYFFNEVTPPTAQANGDNSVAIAGNNNVTIPHEVLVMLSDKDKQLREKDELIAKLTNKLLSL